MRTCPLCFIMPAVLVAAAGLTALGTLGGAGEKPAPATAPLAGGFAVDGVHSFVTFRVKHNNVSYAYGRFNKVSGSFDIDPAKAESGTIDVTVDASSIDTGNEKRDTHLKSADFFSVKEFDSLTFKSKSMKKAGDKYECTGDLTVHGVTKSVTVPVDLVGTGEGRGGAKLAGIESKFTIKRSDFGMNFMVGPLGDEVTVVVALEGGSK